MTPVELKAQEPGFIRIATSDVAASRPTIPLARVAKPARPAKGLRPKVRSAYKATLERHLAAYKYLAK